jgi:glucokinase
MHTPLRLLADIGGTNARFGLYDGAQIRDERQVHCADFASIDLAIAHYLNSIGEQRAVQEAALAIAAPLSGDEIKMTNNHWHFSVSGLRQQLHWRRLLVLNDFTALAMAIRYLPEHELTQVGGAKHASEAPIALLGAGTGLGVSGLVYSGEHWLPLQGEGGHVSLAPGNDREAAVLKQLWRQFDHVSAERVLSGPGLVNLYTAICAVDQVAVALDDPAEITQRALKHLDQQCVETLQMFCGLLGSVAGNLVLTLGATNAVYVGGGIVPRLGDYFVQSSFRRRFEGKGRYVEYLRAVPVYVINSAQPALLGLAQAFTNPGARLESVG